jgi:hypothetical protein
MEAFTEQLKQSALKAAMVAQTTLASSNGFLDDMAASDAYVQSEGYNNNKNHSSHQSKNSNGTRNNTDGSSHANNHSIASGSTVTTTYDDGTAETNRNHTNSNHHPNPSVRVESQSLPSSSFTNSSRTIPLFRTNSTSDNDGNTKEDEKEEDLTQLLLATTTSTTNLQPPTTRSSSSLRPHRFMEDLEARLAQELPDATVPVQIQESHPPLSSWFSNTITTMGIPVPSSLLPLSSNNNNNSRKSTTKPPPLSRNRNSRHVSFYDDPTDTNVELVSSITLLNPSEMEQLQQLRALENSSSSSTTTTIFGRVCRVVAALPQFCSDSTTIIHRREIRMLIMVGLVLGGGFMYYWLEANVLSRNPLRS